MFSRAFYFVFPLAVVMGILAVSAPAATKQKQPAAHSLREAVEQDQVEDMTSPDIPDPVSMPEKPQQNNLKAAAPDQMESYGRATLRAAVTPAAPLEKGKEAQLTLSLHDAGGQPVTFDSLIERHTKKIHLLIVDDSMSDYQHVHPQAGKKAGEYTFAFTPHTGYNYMLYADVKPTGGAPQMVPVVLQGAEKCADPCVDKAVIDTAVFNGNKARLSFAHKKLKAGTPARGELFLSSEDNTPLKTLEPVMGAYAHIAGFYEGFGAVVHAHPLGAEPEKDADRGASPLSFMLHPDNPGFMKIFVQIRIDGKDIFLPFSVFVDP